MKTIIDLNGADWQLIHLMPSEWMWRSVWKQDWDPYHSPAAGSWLNATVPGDVIADAWDANLIANPYVDMQSRAAEWTSERDWVYRKVFDVPAECFGKLLRLRFDGVDYTCHVYLNGTLLGKHEGMFTPFEFDITSQVKFDGRNMLVVVVEHKPSVESVQGQIGWSSNARLWKSRFTYNWDWCTRLVPLGIWKSVNVIVTDAVYIGDVWVQQTTNHDLAHLKVSVAYKSPNGNTESHNLYGRCRVASPGGAETVHGEAKRVRLDMADGVEIFECAIERPMLWWPNGMGEQPLYQVVVELLKGTELTETHTVSIGLRNIRAIANEGAPGDALPYTIEVNGRRMFVNGWNWAPIDNLYGRVQLNRYQRLLDLAKNAHCNLLRVWGGGLLEREEFYDLCDRYGILVWQEFHQSSSGINNRPPEDAEYLQSIEQQARRMIPQKRNHPCLAIWCGGNELMDDNMVPLNDAHPALARLKAIVEELDPGRLWLPTSSSGPVEGADSKLAGTNKMHDVHGPWQYLGPEEHYRFFNSIDALYHSEFGSEGAGNLYTIMRYISDCYRWPPTAANPAWVHHGSWWLHAEKLEGMFGEISDLETFVKASQWMQAEGLRYAIESNRRRQWRCSGTSPWQLNEAFPNTACTNSVDFLGLTKPAYWWVRRSYEPTHISLKYERLLWEPGSVWHAELWCSNASIGMSGCSWTMQLLNLDGSPVASEAGVCDLPDNASIKVAELSARFPDDADTFIAVVTLSGDDGLLLSRNEYVFTTTRPHLQHLLHAPQTTLSAVVNGGDIEIANTGHNVALYVQLVPLDDQWITLDDDYYLLKPGELKAIRYTGSGIAQVCAWNCKPIELHLNHL